MDDDCLKERKWWCFFLIKNIIYKKRWCFFLSSILTFITGVASVLIVRAFNSVFRKKVSVETDQSDIFCWQRKNEYGKRPGGRENSSFLVGCTHCPDAGREKEGTKLPTYLLPGKKIDSWKISVRETSEKFD